MTRASARNAVKDLRPLRGADASLTASSLRLLFLLSGQPMLPLFYQPTRLTHVSEHVLPMSPEHSILGGAYIRLFR
jgi:hypothetical protein